MPLQAPPPSLSSGCTVGTMLSNWWTRRRYRLYAPVYDLAARPLERGRRRAIDRLDLDPGDRVLIPGCGTGSDLPYLPEDVEVTALDLTPVMVHRTANRADSLAVDVDALIGDAQRLPVAADTVDAVLLHLVLSVVPDPGAVAAETARVLAPDGQVSIYDKFVPDDEDPSLLRRALNPVTRALFSDITRQLGPLLAATDLEPGPRESVLGGIYTVTVAEPGGPNRRESVESHDSA